MRPFAAITFVVMGFLVLAACGVTTPPSAPQPDPADATLTPIPSLTPIPTPTPMSSVLPYPSPPPALLVVDGREQTAKLGTNCWSEGGGGLCADHYGIPTPVEALEVPPGSFPTLVLRRLTDDGSVRMQIFRVDEIEEITFDGDSGVRVWAGRGEGERRELRSVLSQEFPLDLGPGEYVLSLHVGWRLLGDAYYGFLIRVR